jgi:hypothetical protein
LSARQLRKTRHLNINNSTESGGDLAHLFDGISYDSENEDGGSTGVTDFDFTNNVNSVANEEDGVDLYDGVSYDSEDEWSSGMELEEEEPTMVIDFELDDITNFGIRKVDSYPDVCTNTDHLARHQIYPIIAEES